MKRYVALFMIAGMIGTVPAFAVEDSSDAGTDASYDEAVTLSAAVEDSSEIDEFSEVELTVEAEPSELPDADVDENLTSSLSGEMLLQVEGAGEVYYVDPVDGGKEYLADGEAAYNLLRRRALGITNANLETIPVGTEAEDSNVCSETSLGDKLRGRILLQVEENGEAWYVRPKNCRRYYLGTYEKAYEIMKKLSLGITDENLAKVKDSARQKVKRALRYSVAYLVNEKDMTVEEAKEKVKAGVEKTKSCYRTTLGEFTAEELDGLYGEKRAMARRCAAKTVLPKISDEKKTEIKRNIRESRRKIMHRIRNTQNDSNVSDESDM